MGLAQKVLLNASLLALGRFINAGLSIAAVGVTTRYLGLHDYGTLITAVAFVAIFSSLTDLGLWTIGSRELAKRPDEEEHLIGVLVTLGIGIALGATVAGAVAMLLLYSAEVEREAIAILLLQLPLTAPIAATGAYFIAHQKAYIGMIASSAGAFLMVGLILLVVELDLGFTAIVAAYLANGLGFGLVMLAFSVRRISLRPRFDRAVSVQLVRWALPLGGFVLVTSLYTKLDILMLSWISSNAEVALYGLAFKVVETLVVLPSYVTITLLPEFARLTENRERREAIMQKALTVTQVAVVPLVVFVLMLAPEISDILGGPDFRGSAPVLRILIPGVGLIFFTTVFSQALIAFNRQGALFRVASIGLGVNAVLNVVLIPPFGAQGAALAFLASEIVGLSLMIRVYLGLARTPTVYRPFPVAAAGLAMAAAVVLCELMVGGSSAAVLALGGAVGLAAYIAALYGLRAVPEEIHTVVVRPLWRRLRPRPGDAV